MLSCLRYFLAALVLGLLSPAPTATASLVVDIPAAQVGGFYAGGGADNLPHFQNYFVGYGTSPGGTRTDERRSFFVFPLSSVGGPIESATLTLHHVFGGTVFGKGPGDPPMPPDMLDPDMSETFQLTWTPFLSGMVTSPMITPGGVTTIFATMDDFPVAAPLTFTFGEGSPSPPPTEPMVGVPALVTIELDGAGIGLLNTALSFGEIVLSGWMPSWTDDDRVFPPMHPMAGDLVEGSELMFGFTDVHKPDFPEPFLTVTYAAVPELGSATLVAGAGAVCLALRRARRAWN